MRVGFGRAQLHERFEQPGRPAFLLGPWTFVATQVDLIAAGDVEVAEAAPDPLGHLLVLHDVDPVRLVVADALGGDVRQVGPAQRRQDLHQLGAPLGQPRVPAQCPRGRDERHEVAALRLVVQELLDGLLRALALIRRQVHVVEEDDERTTLVRLDADVRRVAIRPLRRPIGLRRLRGDHRLKDLNALPAAFLRHDEVARLEVRHGLAFPVEHHDIDGHQLRFRAKRRRLQRFVLPGQRSASKEDERQQQRDAGHYGISVKSVRESALVAPWVATARSS